MTKKNYTQERCKTYQSVWSDVLNQKSILARDPSRPKWLQQEPLQLIMIFRKFPQFTRAVLFLPVTSYAISPSVRWSRIRAGPHPGGHLQQTLADGPNAPRSPVAVNWSLDCKKSEKYRFVRFHFPTWHWTLVLVANLLLLWSVYGHILLALSGSCQPFIRVYTVSVASLCAASTGYRAGGPLGPWCPS